MPQKTNLTESLNSLQEIVTWFEEQVDVDVEEGLTKVKLAAQLIKDSKSRLAEIENDFNVIENDILVDEPTEEADVNSNPAESEIAPVESDEVDLDSIPF